MKATKMLFRPGLRIPFALALVLASTGFFFKVPTTEALKCYSCEYKRDVPDTHKCNSRGADLEDCSDTHLADYLKVKDVIPVCATDEFKLNGEVLRANRYCTIHGEGEVGKCFEDRNYHPKSGCVSYHPDETARWRAAMDFCANSSRTNTTPASNQSLPVNQIEIERPVKRSGENGTRPDMQFCTCTTDGCNAGPDAPGVIYPLDPDPSTVDPNPVDPDPVYPDHGDDGDDPDEEHAPHPEDNIVNDKGSTVRGSEGVICFSLTLLIHLLAASALWN